MSREDLLRGDKREVRKVFMVDRVELVFLHQFHQMRKLNGDYAARRQQDFHASDEIIHIRDLSESVIGQNQISVPAATHHLVCGCCAEELDQSWNSLVYRHLSHIDGRLDPQTRNVFLDEILQQITVVAGQFNHEAGRVIAETLHHLIYIVAGMLQPTVGIRGEVGVFSEDGFGTHVLLKLNQEAALTYVNVQRIKGLHAVQLFRGEITFAQRRHPKIDQSVPQTGATKATERPSRGNFVALRFDIFQNNFRFHGLVHSGSKFERKSKSISQDNMLAVSGSFRWDKTRGEATVPVKVACSTSENLRAISVCV